MTFALVACLLSVTPAPVSAPPSATAFVHLVDSNDAPLSAVSSLGSSFGMTAVGGVMMLAATVRLITTPQNQMVSNIAMYGTGLMLFNFGPSLADALMGDPWRLVTRGLLRLGLLLGSSLLAVLGPVGMLGTFAGVVAWMGWVGADTLDSVRAPDRWAERENDGRLHRPSSPAGVLFQF